MMRTRFTAKTGIAYRKVGSAWRHVDTNDGRNAVVGPSYETRSELLADHEDYLVRAGWMTEPARAEAEAG